MFLVCSWFLRFDFWFCNRVYLGGRVGRGMSGPLDSFSDLGIQVVRWMRIFCGWEREIVFCFR